MHKRAHDQLKALKIEGAYELTPRYGSLNQSFRDTTLRQRIKQKLELVLRKKFNRPSHHHLSGSVSNVRIGESLIPVQKGDLVELTLKYHPELERNFTYRAVIYRLDFDLDSKFHLALVSESTLPRVFNPSLDCRSPALSRIKTMSVLGQLVKRESLPLYVQDHGIMP